MSIPSSTPTLTRTDYEELSRTLGISAELIANKLSVSRGIDSFTAQQLKDIIKYFKGHTLFKDFIYALKLSGNKTQLVSTVNNALNWVKSRDTNYNTANTSTASSSVYPLPTLPSSHSSSSTSLSSNTSTNSSSSSINSTYHHYTNNPNNSSNHSSSMPRAPMMPARYPAYQQPSGTAPTATNPSTLPNYTHYNQPPSQAYHSHPTATLAHGSTATYPYQNQAAQYAHHQTYSSHQPYNTHTAPQTNPYNRVGSSNYILPNTSSTYPHPSSTHGPYGSSHAQPHASSSSSSSAQQWTLPVQHHSSSSGYNPLHDATQQRNELNGILSSLQFSKYGRSPYERIDHTLASQMIYSYGTTTLTFSLTPATFQKIKRSQVKPPSQVSESQRLDIYLRLFNKDMNKIVPFESRNGWRIRVNGQDIAIPEAKKLNKTKAKGLEIVRPIAINDHLNMYNNSIMIEYIRQNMLQDVFRGAVVCEAVTEVDTDVLMNVLRSEAPTLKVKQEVKTKSCAVCGITSEELQRCSRCKLTWYCSSEHQRVDWTNHKPSCIPKDLQSNHVITRENGSSTVITQKPKFDLNRKPPKRTNDVADDVVVDDDEISETETNLSLRCPLSIDRIQTAAKGKYCTHLTCFDLQTFLMYSQQSFIFQCPICFQPLPYHELEIDPVMNLILDMTNEETEKIRVLPDGDWTEIGVPSEQNNKKRKLTASSAPTPSISSSSAQAPQMNGTSESSSHQHASANSSNRPATADTDVIDFLNDNPDSLLSNGVDDSNSDAGKFYTLPHAPYPNSTNVSPAPPYYQALPNYHLPASFAAAAAASSSSTTSSHANHTSSRQPQQQPPPQRSQTRDGFDDTSHFSKGGSIEDAIEID